MHRLSTRRLQRVRPGSRRRHATLATRTLATRTLATRTTATRTLATRTTATHTLATRTLATLTLALLCTVGTAAGAEEEEQVTVPRSVLDKLLDKVERLESKVEDLEGRSADGRRSDADRSGVGSRVDRIVEEHIEDDPDLFIPRRAALAEEEDEGAYFAGLYTRPFLYEGSNVYVGGYIDLEYTDAEGDDRTFDPHRLVPFIYADVTDRVKVATEIEIEHGNELGVEFAVMDYEISDPVNFRAGIILSPVGKFNLVHDSPIQDLTTRPLLTRTVVPAVSREAGLGFFGSLIDDDDSEWDVSYEIYVSTGFKGLDAAGDNVITQSSGLRDARAKTDNGGSGEFRDNNNNLATMGRLAVSPTAGLEAGVSFHTGTYDENNDNGLTIFDFDLTLSGTAVNRYLGDGGFLSDHVIGPSEFLIEYAHANISRDTFARNSGVIGDMDGYYAQWNYHVFPGFLEGLADKGYVGSGSHFTASARYGETDLDGAKRHRSTFGLNFRPNEAKTVFKAEYQFNDESGDLADEDNDAFWFSVATYF